MDTKIKTCFKCNCAKPISEFYKHKKMADGHLNKCKDCAREDVTRRRNEDIEKVREYDKRRSMQPKRVAARAAYRMTDAGKLSVEKSSAKYRENNKDKRRTIKLVCQKAREVGKINRTPPWITSEQKKSIKLKYSEARWMTQRTGIKHHVDHIIPLLGKNVSGLHVPWNLRVIPAKQNIRKSNNF